jgi:subtilase family serine protease
MHRINYLVSGIIAFGLLAVSVPSFAATSAGLKVLPGHVPKMASGLAPKGPLPLTNQLRLAIGLPLRDPKGLDAFLVQLYNPESPSFRHYLTPEEFSARFGPTAADYQAVTDFALTNGLTVAATHGNRLLVDVTGSVDKIQQAFHLTLRVYPHPTERRDFFAPDREPSVDARLPIVDVSGLNNFVLPHPKSLRRVPAALSAATPRSGSSPTGAYMGNDFRAAYLPGVALTGTGQMLGLLQFDGFYASDIAAYESAAGLPAVPLQTVLLDGYDGVPTTGSKSGNPEVSLDIEMSVSMAPGLSKIVLFEAGPSGIPNDILNAMAASNQVKQFSCSWGWGGGPSTTTDAIFQQMATQGQSFFVASGDSDAFTTGASSANGVDNPSLDNTPSSDAYITTVGGTTLTTTGPGGSWSSETVWNWGLDDGSYVGSSGGISSYYAIPSWQASTSMSANGGSTSYRNIPDVALTADNVYVIYNGNGTSATFGGTSCATPLWAGLTALVNQQATSGGKPSVGFINPAIYSVGNGASYSSDFHDITTGNNVWSDSPDQFYATAGYDLCTGWGTPAGAALINSLAGVAGSMAVIPSTGFTSTGPVGGPFAPGSQTLLLTNSGTVSLGWSMITTSAWLNLSPNSGTLAARASIPVSAGFTVGAGRLAPGIYIASVLLTNQSGGTLTFPVTLTIGQNAVQNGGFETGSFADWTFTGDTTHRHEVYDAVESASSVLLAVHSGSYGAYLGDTKLASLSQVLTTVPGQYYLLSLWLDNPDSGTVQQFIVNWNTNSSVNNPLFDLLNPPSFSWTNLQFLVQATGTNTTLLIQAENDPAYFGLDDVSATPIPFPAFQEAAVSAQGFQLSWAATTGLVYQVQYKTNLLQPSWGNLAAPFAATSFSSSLLDTNAVGVSRQRFYRLMVSP